MLTREKASPEERGKYMVRRRTATYPGSHYGTRARKEENGIEEKYVSVAGFPFERVNK